MHDWCKQNQYSIDYADDIVLCTNSMTTMNTLYTKFSSEISDVKLKINKDETKCMLLGSKAKQKDTTLLPLNTDEPEIVYKYKYLKDDKNVEKMLVFELHFEKFQKCKYYYVFNPF